MLALKTIKMPWINIGTIVTATAHADAALGVTERDFNTNKDLTNFIWKEIPSGINVLETRFKMTTDGANEIIDVWAGRINDRTDGNIELARVCSLDVECGTQDADDSTHNYADEIIVTNANWLKTISVVQSGNNTNFLARLLFDLCGYDLIAFHGRTPATEDCIIEISGF